MLLTTVARTPLSPQALLARAGAEIFATFDHRTQDSGNISYGVRTDGGDFFVKTAGLREDDRPLLGFSDRVRLLQRAAVLHRGCDHPVLATLRNVIASAEGPMLVYDWAPGALLRGPHLERFRRLPQRTALGVLDRIYAAHAALGAQGWIAVDFYDGCLLYDEETDRITLVDLDMYRDRPFRNQMGRMFGSSRFMAPEEHTLGARIDQRTTVYTLGRAACVLAPGLESAVIAQACRPDRAGRFPNVAAFWAAWQAERIDVIGGGRCEDKQQ